jgi:hypothetical protein
VIELAVSVPTQTGARQVGYGLSIGQMLVALNAQSLLTYLRQSMKAWFRVGIATTIGGKSGTLQPPVRNTASDSVLAVYITEQKPTKTRNSPRLEPCNKEGV